MIIKWLLLLDLLYILLAMEYSCQSNLSVTWQISIQLRPKQMHYDNQMHWSKDDLGLKVHSHWYLYNYWYRNESL